MKKIFLLLAVACLSVQVGRAQSEGNEAALLQKVDSLQALVNTLSSRAENAETRLVEINVWNKRQSGWSIGYGKSTLTHKEIDGLKWKSNFSLSLDRVKTRYFHKMPIAGMVKFGYDLSFFGVDYTKFASVEGELREDPDDPSQMTREKLDLWEVDYRWSVGPCVYVNPVSELRAGLYFHYRPTLTMLTLDDTYSLAYGSNFAFGGSVVWKQIAIGIEKRWGQAKYNTLSFDDEKVEGTPETPVEEFLSQKKNKIKNSGFRVYLQYRF